MSLPNQSFAQKFRFDNVQDLRLDFSDSDEHKDEDAYDPAASDLADQGGVEEGLNKASPSKFKTAVQSAKNQQIFNYHGGAGEVSPFGHF